MRVYGSNFVNNSVSVFSNSFNVEIEESNFTLGVSGVAVYDTCQNGNSVDVKLRNCTFLDHSNSVLCSGDNSSSNPRPSLTVQTCSLINGKSSGNISSAIQTHFCQVHIFSTSILQCSSNSEGGAVFASNSFLNASSSSFLKKLCSQVWRIHLC